MAHLELHEPNKPKLLRGIVIPNVTYLSTAQGKFYLAFKDKQARQFASYHTGWERAGRLSVCIPAEGTLVTTKGRQFEWRMVG